MGGDHASKYRVDVNAPGRQVDSGFRSADIIVAPPISWKSQTFRISVGSGRPHPEPRVLGGKVPRSSSNAASRNNSEEKI
jgi:hypothetical protein